MIQREITVKDIDAIVFKRVVRRLISNKVQHKDVERYISQARALFEEEVKAVRYEKEFLTYHHTPRKEVTELSEEQRLCSTCFKPKEAKEQVFKSRPKDLDAVAIMEYYAPVLEKLSRT